MANVPATITVDFNASYVGCHRLFWRRGAVGAYNGPVLATPECTGGGNPCSITFTDIVDTESCTPVEYEGYVQACCEDETSTTGRVPFVITFTPSPTCLPITFTCDNVPLASFTITDPGSGYDFATQDGDPVTISGGGGSGATATMDVGTGLVKSVLITNAGSLAGKTPEMVLPIGQAESYTYTNQPVNAIVHPGAGTGTTLNLDVTVTFTPGTGLTTVSGIVINGDSDTVWNDFSTFGMLNTNIGGVTGFTGEVQSDETEIVGITLTAPGSGYTTVPTVTIDAPAVPGSTATAIAVLDGCSNGWTVGAKCAGGDYATYPANTKPELGQTFDVCVTDGTLTGGPGAEYATAANPAGCCTTCHSIQVQNDNDTSIWVAYIDCNTGDFAETEVLANTTGTINCIITGSEALSETANVTVTNGSACIIP